MTVSVWLASDVPKSMSTSSDSLYSSLLPPMFPSPAASPTVTLIVLAPAVASFNETELMLAFGGSATAVTLTVSV